MNILQTEIESNHARASAAFSAQSDHFDADEESNEILKWMRTQVYRHEEEFLLSKSRILELNAGTGIDAMHFSRSGHSVFAVDNAPGMIHQLQNKITAYHVEDRVHCMLGSYDRLQNLPAASFTHVFSNFGGLNCIPDLRPVTQQLPRLLIPGATVTFVIMPHVCPWEIAQAFRGKVRLAFRRLGTGTVAHIDGHRFMSYYHSPGNVIRAFGDSFRLVRLRGLASLSPPPYFDQWPKRHPILYAALTRWDERLAKYFPFNRWADHYIITMRFNPPQRKMA
jgi:ubiquinone/menaquinone biosynthesis C-methylase UbiE